MNKKMDVSMSGKGEYWDNASIPLTVVHWLHYLKVFHLTIKIFLMAWMIALLTT